MLRRCCKQHELLLSQPACTLCPNWQLLFFCHACQLKSVHYLLDYDAGAAASEQEKALQQSLLKRVLTDAAVEASPRLLVDAAAVLISAASPSYSQSSMSPSRWMQEGGDDLQQQLDDLARGAVHSLIAKHRLFCSKDLHHPCLHFITGLWLVKYVLGTAAGP